MIFVFSSSAFRLERSLVSAALKRSVSSSQVREIEGETWKEGMMDASLLVVIHPTEAIAQNLLDWKEKQARKLILLGKLPPLLMRHFNIQEFRWPTHFEAASRSLPAPSQAYAESLARIEYRPFKALKMNDWSRPLERFDFMDEWNNLGYGAVKSEGSWGVSLSAKAPEETVLASICMGEEDCASYVAIFEETFSATLWFNRSVGPIDSYEWRLIEYFLSSLGSGKLPCQPVLQEIPWGYEAAVTMRLDCDEDVESARPLWRLYQEEKIPFSLAVHTANLIHPRNHLILKEMQIAGESILSHTATHAPNWGGSYEAALREGKESADRIEAVTGIRPRYAVSPFHQSPDYALKALADLGYEGCIGGIIRNDPEFLLARGGVLFNLPQGFIGHSQQCMLHGECLLAEGDPLRIYKAAFDRAFETRTLFGYLDHPFSERYQYGWKDEAQRVQAHRSLLDHIRARAPKSIFLSENQAMDFLKMKSACEINEKDGCFYVELPEISEGRFSLALEYQGQVFEAQQGKVRT